MALYVRMPAADEHKGNASLGAPAPLIGLMGSGYLAFTVDQGNKGDIRALCPLKILTLMRLQ